MLAAFPRAGAGLPRAPGPLAAALLARGVHCVVRRSEFQEDANRRSWTCVGASCMCGRRVVVEVLGNESGARIELCSGRSLIVCRSVESCAFLREVVMEGLVHI